MSIRASLSFAALVVAAAPLAAQNRGPGDKVPPGHLPPPGLCRIWIDGVPPGRQPGPTDCATARRHAPRNARVIYGERTTAYRDDDRWIERARREAVGRYDDGRYDRDARYDRKDSDRKDVDRTKAGAVDRKAGPTDRTESDLKIADRKDTTRKK
jgi:hypothetical protein